MCSSDLAADGQFLTFEEAKQFEGVVSRAHLALVVVKSIILGRVIPPTRNEGSALWRHKLRELPFVHERIADVIIRAAT